MSNSVTSLSYPTFSASRVRSHASNGWARAAASMLVAASGSIHPRQTVVKWLA